MTTPDFSRDDLIAQLSWQLENGIDCALLDSPARPDSWQKPLTIDAILSGPTERRAAQTTPQAVIQAQTQANDTPSQVKEAPAPAYDMPADRMPSPVASTSKAQPAGTATADLDSITSLEALKEALSQFEGCALKRTATNLVFSDGARDARIMLIGEAPGRDEDRMGLPFVGEAGKMLDKMLATIGLDRSHVYITNLLPWRPPGNRTPTSEETQMLLPFLKRHIQLKNPDVILALGGSSAKSLLDTSLGILKLRGKMQEIDFGGGQPVPVLPTLHPAYLLRSPAQKKLAFTDLLQLRAFYDRLSPT